MSFVEEVHEHKHRVSGFTKANRVKKSERAIEERWRRGRTSWQVWRETGIQTGPSALETKSRRNKQSEVSSCGGRRETAERRESEWEKIRSWSNWGTGGCGVVEISSLRERNAVLHFPAVNIWCDAVESKGNEGLLNGAAYKLLVFLSSRPP